MRLYLDIETIPCQRPDLLERLTQKVRPPGNIKKPETLAKWEAEERPAAVAEAIHKTGLDAAFGQVWCIAWALDDAPVQVMAAASGERELLDTWFSIIRPVADPTLTWIGHNIREFDLPFLWRRGVVHGLRPPFALPVRGWELDVADTMEMWAGRRDRVSLDTLCAVLGIPGKEGMDGSQVWDYVQAGKYSAVQEYCKDDVERVRGIYKRLTFQEG